MRRGVVTMLSKAAFSKHIINRTTDRPLSSRATVEYLCASTIQISWEMSGSAIAWQGLHAARTGLQSASARSIVCDTRTREPATLPGNWCTLNKIWACTWWFKMAPYSEPSNHRNLLKNLCISSWSSDKMMIPQTCALLNWVDLCTVWIKAALEMKKKKGRTINYFQLVLTCTELI